MKSIVSVCSMDEINAFKLMGCSTVLVGLDGFQSGSDGIFTLNELTELKKACDEKNLDVMVMMNRLYFDEETEAVEQAAETVLGLGCRVLYCDPMVYLCAVKCNSVHQLVYDSSTLMCNSNDVSLMQNLGLDSVVLSREITLDEICTIARKSSGKTIVQVYGYQVMAHSKRHFLRNYMKEINKGLDLQDNRNLTLIETTRTGRMPVLEEKEGCRIYTDYVLCAIKELNAMKNAGVDEILLDGIFIDRDEYSKTIQCFMDVLKGADASEQYVLLKQNNDAVSEGYMYTRTNLLKTEGEGR